MAVSNNRLAPWSPGSASNHCTGHTWEVPSDRTLQQHHPLTDELLGKFTRRRVATPGSASDSFSDSVQWVHEQCAVMFRDAEQRMAHWYRYVIIEVVRSPSSFRQQCDESEEMEPWRWPLIIARGSRPGEMEPWRSPTGAKLFVAPEVYGPLLPCIAAEGLALKPRHVIMDPEAVSAFQRSLSALPLREKVRAHIIWQGWVNIEAAVPRTRMPFAQF